MAKIYGTPGKHAFHVHLNRFKLFILMTFLIAGVGGLLMGLYVRHLFGNPWHFTAFFALFLAFAWLTRRIGAPWLERLVEEGINYRKGAEGERLTADALSSLPDTYSVFHDLTHTRIFGNIDHIVVGPTGVFAIETKKWIGSVTLSGHGTLTLDGKHDKTRHAKAILGRAANLKQKIEALADISTFVQAVMVFPTASVQVAPQTSSALAVRRVDLIEAYLTQPHPQRALTPQQVETVTRRLVSLFEPCLK